jgi:hypothetical protein
MSRFVWMGLAIWLTATLAIRFLGQHLFRAGDGTRVAILFGLTALAISVPISLLVRRLPTRDAALRAVVLIVLPGLLLDTGSVYWFGVVFPNLPDSVGLPFAALLLWAYGVALLAAAWPRKGADLAAGPVHS